LIKHPHKDSVSPRPTHDRDLPVTLKTASLINPLELGADEVHVWQAKLDDHEAAGLRGLLAADEVSRADRFHFAKDRDHFTVARGLLRTLLAAYLGANAAELRFAYAEKGKPSLADNQPSAINFNLAHSQGRALFAFSRGREVGVDLEFIREDFEGEKIAERFFSAAEVKTLELVPLELRQQAFFECWTRKEAYIKARGEGLSMPLDEFDVSLRPGEPAALLRNHKEPEEVARWTMRSIAVPIGYVAALVVEGADWRMKMFALETGSGIQNADRERLFPSEE
jgi:4'-phosphopantetheinyl transferase